MWLFGDLFSTVATPKLDELVATPARHGGKEMAEAFFLKGMTRALVQLRSESHPAYPLTIFYAFKQAETEGEEGTVTSPSLHQRRGAPSSPAFGNGQTGIPGPRRSSTCRASKALELDVTTNMRLDEMMDVVAGSKKRGKLRICEDSKQNPKPGYCDVSEPDGTLRLQLYFDGGTERKLQIRHLRKDLCMVHAEWAFEINN